MQPFLALRCPYCGERFETPADVSAGGQDYVEDCPVCCRPIQMQLRIDDDGRARLDASRDD